MDTNLQPETVTGPAVVETDVAAGPDELLDALADYSQAAATLEMFRDRHAQVLVDLEMLEHALTVQEGKVKELARLHGPCANANHSVIVAYRKRRWYDTDYILEHAPWVRQIPGVVVQTVDRGKIEALAKANAIDAGVCDQALREEPLTPAVTIKRK